MELTKIDEILTHYLRPHTHPVAVRLIENSEELPEMTGRPQKDFGIRIALCQAISMARRYGWQMAVDRDDQSCPFGGIAMGFYPLKEAFLKGEFHESLSVGGGEATARTAQAMRHLEYGKYKYLLVAALRRANFEPHVLLIYGTPAQGTRLVQASLHGRGGALIFSSMGDYACSDAIAGVMLSNECVLALPCTGDRIFGLSQDDELIFSIPWNRIEQVLTGLERSHKAGQRYPIPTFLRFEPEWPMAYQPLIDYLRKSED